MNPFIRPGGGPGTELGRLLAQRLPALAVRLRGPTIDDLAQRLAQASPSGSLPTWVISRAEIADTTPIDDHQGLSWGDPGDSAEPGDWENDTDAPRWRDSGGGDSGDSRLGP